MALIKGGTAGCPGAEVSDALNVLGTPLVACSFDPLTGWHRDGCCHTDEHDAGSHVICAKVTVEFLNFQMERGNDLITPRPSSAFAGLEAGRPLVRLRAALARSLRGRLRAAGGAGEHARNAPWSTC